MKGLDRLLDETLSALDPTYVAESIHLGASLATEGDGLVQPGIRAWLDAFGARDLLTILAMDSSGVGAMVAVNLASTAHPGVRQSATFSQISAHVLGAYRLRQDPPSADAAVFGANGDVMQASEEIEAAGVLDDLKNVVRALDGLRSARTEEASAFEQLTSRVDATWSVVAQVDDGTGEWVVAKRNPAPAFALPESLSQREGQVLSLLLLGRTPKIVAYELGIAHSTVRVLSSRALAKVGAKTVDELRKRFSTQQQQ